MYQRNLSLDLSANESVFLFGPRGTGKTSWLRYSFPEAMYFDLLDSGTYTELLASPNVLARRIPANFSGYVIIDEVQKIPEILNEVHRLIEKRGFRFILTGSSARSLRRRGVNLLAGRALTYLMHPLIRDEIGSDFILSACLHNGMLPKALSAGNPSQYLRSYVDTYVREEVQQEALTRNMALFTRFLETASFSQGEELNYAAIAREIGTNGTQVRNFFDLLEDLLLSVRIPVFNKRAKRALAGKFKFYFFDVGVYQTIRPKGPLDCVEEIEGPALETLFLQHLRAINDYCQLGYGIYFWRTRNNIEVDFVLYGENGLFAFEVKRKQKLDRKDFNGLKTFQKDYPMAKCFMIYGGDRFYYENDIPVFPFDQCLCELKLLISP